MIPSVFNRLGESVRGTVFEHPTWWKRGFARVRSVNGFNHLAFLAATLVVALGPSFAFSQPKPKSRLKTNQPIAQSRASVSYATPLENKKTKTQWKLGLTGLSFASQEREENTQLAELSLGAKLELSLLSMLDFKARAGIAMATGQAQTRFGEKVPENRLALEEATLNLRPIDSLLFSAGALDQAALSNPQLVSARAFPGAAEGVEIAFGKTKLGVRAQQVIPTSITMTTKTVGNEKTPMLLTETVTFEANDISIFDLAANASLFDFRDLPAHVANESELGGNTVFATSQLNSRFAYEFAGWTAGASARARLTNRFDLIAGTQALQNTKAPEGSQNAQLAYLSSSIGIGSGVSLIPRAEVFFSESDASPAFYNSGEYFHNNRKGFAASFDAKFEKQKFLVGARFVDASLLEPSLTQAEREQLILLKFETSYADF